MHFMFSSICSVGRLSRIVLVHFVVARMNLLYKLSGIVTLQGFVGLFHHCLTMFCTQFLTVPWSGCWRLRLRPVTKNWSCLFGICWSIWTIKTQSFTRARERNLHLLLLIRVDLSKSISIASSITG